jgi:hypothetical protein
MSEPKPWRPDLPDRAGRGSLCSVIQQIVKDVEEVMPGGPRADKDECARLLARLDKEREKFHRLYGKEP